MATSTRPPLPPREIAMSSRYSKDPFAEIEQLREDNSQLRNQVNNLTGQIQSLTTMVQTLMRATRSPPLESDSDITDTPDLSFSNRKKKKMKKKKKKRKTQISEQNLRIVTTDSVDRTRSDSIAESNTESVDGNETEPNDGAVEVPNDGAVEKVVVEVPNDGAVEKVVVEVHDDGAVKEDEEEPAIEVPECSLTLDVYRAGRKTRFQGPSYCQRHGSHPWEECYGKAHCCRSHFCKNHSCDGSNCSCPWHQLDENGKHMKCFDLGCLCLGHKRVPCISSNCSCPRHVVQDGRPGWCRMCPCPAHKQTTCYRPKKCLEHLELEGLELQTHLRRCGMAHF